jgi:hypothetical protein
MALRLLAFLRSAGIQPVEPLRGGLKTRVFICRSHRQISFRIFASE